MNIITSFLLIGFFIWVAENVSTFFGAWQYPNQKHHWRLVGLGKLTSWFLLVIISIIIVANLKHIKEKLVIGTPILDPDLETVSLNNANDITSKNEDR